MRLSYRHANPAGGNESFLLRYESDTPDFGRACVLVDAGEGVDPDRILDAGDELVAICLTHAHLDHYQSIERCRRENTTIYASEATAAILDDVLDVASRDYEVRTNAATTRAVQPIDDWTELAPGLRVHPVPAGHVPGAVGFLFRIDDGEDSLDLLATGDFTERRAGGYPGLDASAYPDVNVLFLTVATDSEFERNISRGLAMALQRAHSGSRTLVATSGLLGVQVAYLLDGLAAEFDRHVPIRVVGQVAKFYQTLEYDSSNVETIPFFDDPQECVAPGTITVAGPEIPAERSSGRIFGILETDPNAYVVQLVGSGEDPVRSGNCTIESFTVVNHPTRETIEAVHQELDPHDTIVVHRHRGAGKEYNDLDSLVWSPTDDEAYTLYEDGGWIDPPWISASIGRRNRTSNVEAVVGDDLLEELSIPPVGRRETVDLRAEGLDLDLVEDILSQRDAYDRQTDEGEASPSRETPEKPPEPSAQERRETKSMTSEDSETSTGDAPRDEPTTGRSHLEGLVDTTGGGPEGIDERLVDVLESGELSDEDIAWVLRVAEGRVDETDIPDRFPSETGDPSSGQDGDPDGESADDGRGESGAEGTKSEAAEDTGDGTSVDGSGQAQEMAVDEPSPDGEDSSPAEGETSEPTEEAQPEPTSDTPSDSDGEADGSSVKLTLAPLTIALATVGIEETDEETVDAFVTVSVRRYLRGLLEGTVSEPDVPPGEVRVEGPGRLDTALSCVVDRSDEFEDVSELLGAALADQMAPESASESTVHVADLEPYLPLVDAVVENDDYQVDRRADVATIAIRYRVARL